MLIKDLNIERWTVTKPPTEVMKITVEVVIVRDGGTYTVPYNKMYEVPPENYTTEVVEGFFWNFLMECKRISEKWKLVVEVESPLSPVGETIGKVITQRPFDITRDL